jgi:hypothetical protein
LNSEFRDFNHLNYFGAKKFSVWFNTLIKQGMLSQKKKQEFIDKMMQVF